MSEKRNSAIVLLTKYFVAGNAVVWMAFGPTFYFATETFASYLDITLRSPTALADFRGVYGGLHLAIGVFMLTGLFRREWMRPVLLLILLGTTGLLIGRVLTIIDTGGVGIFVHIVSILEFSAIVFGVWLYRNQEDSV